MVTQKYQELKLLNILLPAQCFIFQSNKLFPAVFRNHDVPLSLILFRYRYWANYLIISVPFNIWVARPFVPLFSSAMQAIHPEMTFIIFVNDFSEITFFLVWNYTSVIDLKSIGYIYLSSRSLILQALRIFNGISWAIELPVFIFGPQNHFHLFQIVDGQSYWELVIWHTQLMSRNFIFIGDIVMTWWHLIVPLTALYIEGWKGFTSFLNKFFKYQEQFYACFLLVSLDQKGLQSVFFFQLICLAGTWPFSCRDIRLVFAGPHGGVACTAATFPCWILEALCFQNKRFVFTLSLLYANQTLILAWY